jgi:hypothetical protein
VPTLSLYARYGSEKMKGERERERKRGRRTGGERGREEEGGRYYINCVRIKSTIYLDVEIGASLA